MMFLNELIRYVGHEYLHISGEVEIVVYGAIIVLVMLFMPNGLVGLFSSLRPKKKTVAKSEKASKTIGMQKGV